MGFGNSEQNFGMIAPKFTMAICGTLIVLLIVNTLTE